MARRRIYDDELHAHFVTFSCFRRRRLLDHKRAKEIVLDALASQLGKQSARCLGFIIMPDHVHAIVWFPEPNQLSHFMKQWKQRSSVRVKKLLHEHLTAYAAHTAKDDAFWQRKYYPFHLYSQKKLLEKLDYIHLNPVRAGLVERAVDGPWSSAKWYECKKPVGVPIEWIP